ncbi:MAG: helix-turn-helix domain-containing protein [Clostridia bacterium]|nr:helix-turn-helix domain-containing protein [Clostridia bacterium]
MNIIGRNIKRLRQSKAVTQEQVAEQLHVSSQAVSKWECGSAMPDIALLPALADYFGVSTDELLGYRRGGYTEKENLIRLMYAGGVLTFPNGKIENFRLDTERFTTNAQIAKIGGCFADCIRDNHLAPDMILGIAYHGIAFSSAASYAMFEKYGTTVHYGCDRMIPDSRGRWFCGYTPQDEDRIVIVDDLIYSGTNLSERLDRLLKYAKVKIAGIAVIADVYPEDGTSASGRHQIEERYKTKVFPLLTAEDITAAYRDGIIAPESI